MSTVRLYLPEIVLVLWAGIWAAGITADIVVIVGLIATAGAVAVCVGELRRRYQRGSHGWHRHSSS